MHLNEGDIIEAPFFNEPVKVEKITEIGNRCRVIGVTTRSKQLIDRIITNEEKEKIKVKKLSIDFDADPEHAFYVIEASRFKFASLFDPLLGMNVSKIDPLPFQIEAVYGYVLKQPRIRF
ncbi:MAG: helicase, partial [Thermoprotei archaeon]